MKFKFLTSLLTALLVLSMPVQAGQLILKDEVTVKDEVIMKGVNKVEFFAHDIKEPDEFLKFPLKPYIGFDFQSRNMKYTKGLGDNIFKKQSPQGNAYIGLKLNEHLGLEVGYETTPMRTKSANIPEGQLSLGTSPLFAPEMYLTKTKLKGWHAGIMGFMPVYDLFCNPLELLGYIGHVRLKSFHQAILAGDSLGPTNILSSSRTFVARKSLLKLAAGLQYTFKNSGFRFMVGHENTRRFKNIVPQELSASNKRLSFRNSLMFSAGVFITMN